MDFEFTEEQKKLQKRARDFANNVIAPGVEPAEKGHKFQRDLLLKMGEQGFFGCPIPPAYGGNGLGFVAHTIVCEEVGRVCGALRPAFNMQVMGSAKPILDFGTEELKKKYIPGLVSCQSLAAFCITEPEAGSDAASMSTNAVLDGDHYILNGSKTWITYCTVADVGIVYAYTDRSQKHKGISCLVVDMHSPGITSQALDKMGIHSCPSGQVFFENVRVPKSNVLGKPGQGWDILMDDLNNTRLSTAAGAVGACQGLVDRVIKFAKETQQSGQELGRLQSVQDIISRMVVETEAARLLTYRCAVQKDQGLKNTLETSIAKYYASEAASRVSDLAFQVMGVRGYSDEYPVERMWRENKLYPIIEGSANIQKVIIGTSVLGYRR